MPQKGLITQEITAAVTAADEADVSIVATAAQKID
jgi:hypothetical protein